MKALRKLSQGPGHVAVVDLPDPLPGDGQVLIRVAKGGICGTDLHIFHGLFSKVRPPVTLGHEISGTVEALGTGVTGWRPGDRVTVESEAFSCGKCRLCTSGLSNLCPHRRALGYGVDGGFASFLAVRQAALHRLPEGVTFNDGALCEPLTVAVHAVLERATIEKDAWILVTGPGAIGLLVMQVAHTEGARVIVTGTEKDQMRLDLAKQLGAEAVIRVQEENLQDRLFELTAGVGVQTAFECSGAGGAMNSCLDSVASRGEIVQVGLFGSPVAADMDLLATKEIDLKGSFVHNHGTWKRAMGLLKEKKIDLSPMVSGEYPIERW